MVLHKDFFSPEYAQQCLEFTQLPHPGDNWGGAVLLLKVDNCFLLIKRSETMPSHKGHIALVGGRKNPMETPAETAIREFSEETYLETNNLVVLGFLPPVFTARNFQIIPVVGELKNTSWEMLTNIKSNGEWSHCFIVDEEIFKDDSKWSFARRYGKDTDGTILFFPLEKNMIQMIKGEGPPLGLQMIWGATARIIWNYIKLTKGVLN